ncbi:MAG TPA: hypothetical protein VK826_10240 [Bacteroidia bacterium]|nr:hypothetical protein [Bacteroidia bacterium]
MSQKNRSNLYEEFKNGDIPNESDFADTIDSALNLVDDGLVSYKVDTPSGVLKRFGMGGETAPDCPLGIKGETGQDDQMICFTSSDESQKWNINLNPTGENITGFSIDDQTSGVSNSRFFIDQASEGNIGVGTVEPVQKLHVQGAKDGANVSIMVENLESGADGGWLMSAIDDNVVPERMRTFAIQEKIDSELTERMTFLSTGGNPANPMHNVGINEVLPYATLHVSRPASDPLQKINLAENTGILVLGPIDNQNLGLDSNQVQARTGIYEEDMLSFTATELRLQPLGGGLLINGALGFKQRVNISTEGNIGIGKTATEKVEINGALTVGDTDTSIPPDGTIRFGGPSDDLEVWKDGDWTSLTTHTVTDGIWTDSGDGVVYYDGIEPSHNPKVGIGVTVPNAALHVREENSVTSGNSGALLVNNFGHTESTDSALTRVGLGVTCTGVWSSNANALNFGIYVSNVIGQTNPHSNIAAAFNGNTVIGGITGNSLIGDNGKNVLAIQNGVVPNTTPGITPTTGIQIYSSNVTFLDGVDKSVFNVMTGDSEVIQLYRQPNMAEASLTVPNSGDANTDALIENMRLRINQLEDILKALGILAP